MQFYSARMQFHVIYNFTILQLSSFTQPQSKGLLLFLITEVARIFWLLYSTVNITCYFDKNWVGLHFGALFSETHLVTLQPAETIGRRDCCRCCQSPSPDVTVMVSKLWAYLPTIDRCWAPRLFNFECINEKNMD
jgi:hypothetical protein